MCKYVYIYIYVHTYIYTYVLPHTYSLTYILYAQIFTEYIHTHHTAVSLGVELLRDGYEGLLFYNSLFDLYSTDGGSSSSIVMNDNYGRSWKSTQRRLAQSNHHHQHYNNLLHSMDNTKRSDSPMSLKISSSMNHMSNKLVNTITMHTAGSHDLHPNNSLHRIHHHHHHDVVPTNRSNSNSNSNLVHAMRRMIFKSKVRDQQSNVWALIDIDSTEGDDGNDDDDMMATSNNAFASATTATIASSTYGDDRRFLTTYIDQHIDNDDVLRQAVHHHHHHHHQQQQHQHTIDDIASPPPAAAIMMSSNPFLSANKASSGVLPPYSSSFSSTSPYHHHHHHHQQQHNDEKRHPHMHSTDHKGYLPLKQPSLDVTRVVLSTVIRSLNLYGDDEVMEVRIALMIVHSCYTTLLYHYHILRIFNHDIYHHHYYFFIIIIIIIIIISAQATGIREAFGA